MSRVRERRREAHSVMATARTIAARSSAAESRDPARPLPVTKNMVRSAMRVGKRPLQGTKLLVRMAISRSRGLSMMRQPITPQALQPKPMHMVRLCRPQAPEHLKWWSKLKATRGR